MSVWNFIHGYFDVIRQLSNVAITEPDHALPDKKVNTFLFHGRAIIIDIQVMQCLEILSDAVISQIFETLISEGQLYWQAVVFTDLVDSQLETLTSITSCYVSLLDLNIDFHVYSWTHVPSGRHTYSTQVRSSEISWTWFIIMIYDCLLSSRIHLELCHVPWHIINSVFSCLSVMYQALKAI